LPQTVIEPATLRLASLPSSRCAVHVLVTVGCALDPPHDACGASATGKMQLNCSIHKAAASSIHYRAPFGASATQATAPTPHITRLGPGQARLCLVTASPAAPRGRVELSLPRTSVYFGPSPVPRPAAVAASVASAARTSCGSGSPQSNSAPLQRRVELRVWAAVRQSRAFGLQQARHRAHCPRSAQPCSGPSTAVRHVRTRFSGEEEGDDSRVPPGYSEVQRCFADRVGHVNRILRARARHARNEQLTDALRLLLARPPHSTSGPSDLVTAADVLRASVVGDNPLHVAAARGQEAALSLLLAGSKALPSQLRASSRHDDRTPSVANGHVSVGIGGNSDRRKACAAVTVVAPERRPLATQWTRLGSSRPCQMR
jgi:hypothetical protein